MSLGNLCLDSQWGASDLKLFFKLKHFLFRASNHATQPHNFPFYPLVLRGCLPKFLITQIGHNIDLPRILHMNYTLCSSFTNAFCFGSNCFLPHFQGVELQCKINGIFRRMFHLPKCYYICVFETAVILKHCLHLKNIG